MKHSVEFDYKNRISL